ncbi:para-aminobenzoate synthetase / 4-amino-4-deoxychorismate lyase [Devosia enhydra]|uniref:Probable branched-chain-amino-acid aminotransferase n=1 Tax=Devosia enhydra TaxID=665118 RepID=A0A1K2HYG4_9HYPH|nr:aminodeoxychorismate synthase component I [Devosia enhydra]SFZ85005.1 para-aminobenzoate synthetase / 4-amino-4-deoxychorismate lyase [Devosia enhydra]
MIDIGTVLLDDALAGRALLFAAPRDWISARRGAEVPDALARMRKAREAGYYLAGALGYELGLWREERLRPLLPDADLPLIEMGVFDAPEVLAGHDRIDCLRRCGRGPAEVELRRLGHDGADHGAAVAAILRYIAAGDIYQANLTFRARLESRGDPAALYRLLVAAQPVAHGALMRLADAHVLSLSPELFVANEGGRLTARPMKGTMARGATQEADAAARARLAADAKNRAENLMIVDLLRNDLSRIARIGSVRVPQLFAVETYPSLHQMTSTITAEMAEGIDPIDALLSLFPCGSITGAPKIRAMEIIAELEPEPRGFYTGAIGSIAPDGDFRFNVAIRTLVIGPDGRGEIGVGGGIVADSEAGDEYEEALLKMSFLKAAEPPGLIETLLWEEGRGYWLLDRHLERLAASAGALGIALDDGAAGDALEAAISGFSAPRMRVRLLLDPRDGLSVTAVPMPPQAPGPFRFAIAPEIIDETDPLLIHKTTRRHIYDPPREAMKALLPIDEVVFLNTRGELTEGSITSLFVERDGVLLTPPLASGLLAGVLRAELIATGRAREAVLRPADLEGAIIHLGNSLRGLMPAKLVAPEAGA